MRQNLHVELIALLDRNLRLPYNSHTGRRARNDQCPRWQRRTLRQAANQFRYREDQIVRATVLQDIAVLQTSDMQFRWVWDQTRRHECRTYRTGAVKTLGKAPLTLRELARSAGDVVARRITQHVVHRVRFGDVLGRLA